MSKPLVERTSGLLIADDTTLDKLFAYIIAIDQANIIVSFRASTCSHCYGVTVKLASCVMNACMDARNNNLSRNDHFRTTLDTAKQHGFLPRYVCFDSWCSGLANLKHIILLRRLLNVRLPAVTFVSFNKKLSRQRFNMLGGTARALSLSKDEIQRRNNVMNGYKIETNVNNTLDKIDTTFRSVQSQATSGLNAQINKQPWLALGAALAAGFVFGNLVGGNDDDDRRSSTHEFARQQGEYGTLPNQHVQSSPALFGGQYRPYSTSPSMAAPTTPSAPETVNTFAHNSYEQPEGPKQAVGSEEASTTTDRSSNMTSNAASGIASAFSSQIDSVSSVAVDTVRSFLRNTIRDAVPSLRDQVDALDRRDGRQPLSPNSTSKSTSLREIDAASPRTEDPSLS